MSSDDTSAQFQELLSILVCPQDNGPLTLKGDYLVNPRLSIAYPIDDGIPVLLHDAAIEWVEQ